MTVPDERPPDALAQPQGHLDALARPLPVGNSLKPGADSMWTTFAVDPIALRMAPVLARRPAVTPNRITAVAVCLGLASATSFARGGLLVGGVLFQLRFVADCLDGKVARLRGLSSARGGAFDLMADVFTITPNYAALSLYVVRRGAAPPKLAVSTVASSLLFAWMLTYRKSLEQTKEASPNGPDRDVSSSSHTESSALRRAAAAYVGWMSRHRSKPVPYTVEAEIFTLSLAPAAAGLLGGADRLLVWSLRAVTAFYGCALVVNARRVWRLASSIDADRRRAQIPGADAETTGRTGAPPTPAGPEGNTGSATPR